ncbi:MAG: TolC family protein [Gemmatimonadales bacterium]|nr:MAG: TolC family protein [Gemmatimonadales bacterium]
MLRPYTGSRTSRAGRLPQLELGGVWTSNLKKPSFFLPSDMAAGFGGESVIEMGGDWDMQAAATLTWNLWTAGRLSAARGAAAEVLAATEWERDAVRDGVIFTAEAAYYNVLLAAEQVDIAQQAQIASAEALRVTEAAFEQGTASRFDLLRARVEEANREAPVVQARNRLLLQNLQLLRVCGLPHGTTISLTDSLAGVAPAEQLDALLERMHDRSPELRALTHAVAARRQSVSLAKAARGPVVQFQGRYALQGQWDDSIFPDENGAVTSASAALAVSLPVFDGFTAKAGIQRSRADSRSAEIELERVTRDRDLSVRQAHLNLENALAALEGRREGADLATEAYRLAVVRLENGLATGLERLDAELAMTEARVQLAESLYNCNLAEAGLKLAVGGSDVSLPAIKEKK